MDGLTTSLQLSQSPLLNWVGNGETPTAAAPTTRKTSHTNTPRPYAERMAQAAAFFKGPSTVFEDFATAWQEGVAYHYAIAAAAVPWVKRDPKLAWLDFNEAKLAGFERPEAFEIAARQSLKMTNPTWHLWRRIYDETRWQLLAATRDYKLANTLSDEEAEYMYFFRAVYGRSEVIVRGAGVDPNSATAPQAAPAPQAKVPPRRFERIAKSAAPIVDYMAKVDQIAERHGFTRVSVRLRGSRVMSGCKLVPKDGHKATREENERVNADLKRLTETGSVDGVGDTRPVVESAITKGSQPSVVIQGGDGNNGADVGGNDTLSYVRINYAFIVRQRRENEQCAIGFTSRGQPVNVDLNEVKGRRKPLKWCVLAHVEDTPRGKLVIVAKAITNKGAEAALSHLVRCNSDPKIAASLTKINGVARSELRELVVMPWNARVQAIATYPASDTARAILADEAALLGLYPAKRVDAKGAAGGRFELVDEITGARPATVEATRRGGVRH